MQVNPVVPIGQLSDADLRLLRVFKAVVDCGGMASAELELNLAMSTISRHVKDLETRLGLVLCRRGRGGFALTPEGEQLYAATERLLTSGPNTLLLWVRLKKSFVHPTKSFRHRATPVMQF